MKKDITRKITALILAASLMASLAACSSDDSDETEEEETTTTTAEETTSEETSEETTEETTVEETTEETSEATEPTRVLYDAPSCSQEEDDNRYRAFFETEYATMADDMYLTNNGIVPEFTYSDLDHDGTDELLIGSAEGIFAVITEVDGSYNIAPVHGWGIQYGAESSEYIGNGCFVASNSAGNNYGGESGVNVIWKYDTNLRTCGVYARYSFGWDFDGKCMYKFYILNEGATMSTSYYESDMEAAADNYTYTYIDYGDFLSDEEDELKHQFGNAVDSLRTDSSLDLLEWRSVEVMLPA